MDILSLEDHEHELIKTYAIDSTLALARGVDKVHMRRVFTRINANGLSALAIDYVAFNGHTVEGLVKIDEHNRAGLDETQIAVLGKMAESRPVVVI